MRTESRELINYYLILDIRRNADLDAIETAYARMALKHHPDVAGDSPEVQERFALINEAYSVLSNTEKKREYDQKLGTPSEIYQEEVITSDEGTGAESSDSAPAPGPEVRKRPEPVRTTADKMSRKRLDLLMSRARKLIGKGDFWGAENLLRKAVLAFPTDPDIRRLLAKTAEGRGRLREAVEELKAAAETEYFNPENHYLMGRMYMKAGQADRARKAFTDALSWQEDYEPALKGLAELQAIRRSRLPWWKKLFRMGG